MVLLDEADVFLEERTLKNLERNALVSGRFTLRHALPASGRWQEDRPCGN